MDGHDKRFGLTPEQYIGNSYFFGLFSTLAASNCQPGHHSVSAIPNTLHGPGCC